MGPKFRLAHIFGLGRAADSTFRSWPTVPAKEFYLGGVEPKGISYLEESTRLQSLKVDACWGFLLLIIPSIFLGSHRT